MRTSIFPAHFNQLEIIRDFVNQASMDAGMDEEGRCAIEMAVDEACSNIIEHAYKGMVPGDIECTCDHDAHRMTIILRDHGKPFDPDTVDTPDLTNPLSKRKIGGLGVYLINSLMDEVRYEAQSETGNILTLVRRKKDKE